MTIRTRLFISIFLVSACVAGAIVAFSTVATGVALHQHDAVNAGENAAVLTPEMHNFARAVQHELLLKGGPPHIIRPGKRIDALWNVALVNSAGTIVAASKSYLPGMHVTFGYPMLAISSPPRGKRPGKIWTRLAEHLTVRIPVQDGTANGVRELLFMSNGSGFQRYAFAQTQDRLTRLFWFAAIIAVLASAIASAVLSGVLTGPLRALTRAATQMSGGDFSVRVPYRGGGETGELAAAFNSMADMIAGAERRRNEMAGDIAHELRTPLNTIHAQLEAIEAGVLLPTPERVRLLIDESERLAELISDLQQLTLLDSGAPPFNREPLSPFEILTAVGAKCEGAAVKHAVRIEISCPPQIPMIEADVRALRQILVNLSANAVRHARAVVRMEAVVCGKAVQFTVADDGAGIAPEHLDAIFERFFRAGTARSREDGGSGLGLAIAKRLVEAHGGAIEAANGPSGGARFTFTMPLYEA